MNHDKGNPEFTDLTNTLYFLSVYVDKIRYCITLEKFLVWNGTNWEIEEYKQLSERYNIPIIILISFYRSIQIWCDVIMKLGLEYD